MKIQTTRKETYKQMLLIPTDVHEAKKFEDFSRPWQPLEAQLRTNKAYKYPYLDIRKEL